MVDVAQEEVAHGRLSFSSFLARYARASKPRPNPELVNCISRERKQSLQSGNVSRVHASRAHRADRGVRQPVAGPAGAEPRGEPLANLRPGRAIVPGQRRRLCRVLFLVRSAHRNVECLRTIESRDAIERLLTKRARPAGRDTLSGR